MACFITEPLTSEIARVRGIFGANSTRSAHSHIPGFHHPHERGEAFALEAGGG